MLAEFCKCTLIMCYNCRFTLNDNRCPMCRQDLKYVGKSIASEKAKKEVEGQQYCATAMDDDNDDDDDDDNNSDFDENAELDGDAYN